MCMSIRLTATYENLLQNYESPRGFNDRRRVPMIKAALFICLAAAYVFTAFSLSSLLGAFIHYHENA